MPRASPGLFSFNAGIFSPNLDGRVDIDKYASASREMDNFFPLIAGAAKKRSGTRFVREVKNSAKATRVVSFEFSTSQAYILEFGDLYMRVYRNGGIVLDGVGPAVFELTTTYAAADLDGLYFSQSADVLYVAHPNYASRKIQRTDHDAWTIADIDFIWQPFQPENLDDTHTIFASAVTGAITLSSSAAVFTADMVGGYVKLREIISSNHGKWESASANTDYAAFPNGASRYFGDNVYTVTTAGTSGTSPPVHKTGAETDGQLVWTYVHSGAGYAKITGFMSSTAVSADVIKTFPISCLTPGTFRWSLGAWSTENGFPRCVAFYEDRLAFAGSTANPQSIWLSKTGQYEDHEQTDEDESALLFTLNTDEVNVIEWISPAEELAIGTAGGEFTLSASNISDPLTAGNVRAPRRGTAGSRPQVQPVRVGAQVLFVQRSGRKLLEFVFDFDTDGFVAVDTSILADTVVQPGIRKIAFQKEPHRIVWVVLDDGQLVGLSYERDQQVTGWHRHPLGGTDVIVESVAVIPHPDEDEDQVWLVVKRTIDGVTVRYVEYIEKEWLATKDQEDAFFVDSGLTYDSTPATVFTGLDHLEGETVAILADGAVRPSLTVSSGSITLQSSASVVHVGLAYNADLQTMRLEAGSAEGIAQGKTKRLHLAVFRHNLPLPCTLIAMFPQLSTQDGG